MVYIYGYLLCINLLIFQVYVSCQTPTSVPPELQSCYHRSYSPASRPPLTVPVLVEFLRKIEGNPNCTMNTRRLSTWLMHKVVIDGVIRATGRTVDESFGIPYAATLNKFHKYKVINDYLLDQSTTTISPREFLTLDELCFLHKLTSNSIYESEEGSVTCLDNSFSPIQSPSALNDVINACPLKLGNIKTNWGSISVSHLIAGIATGLEQNQVTYQRLLDSIKSHSETRNSSSFLLGNSNDINHEVDNVLFATIIGDLGEVVLSQATQHPIIGHQVYLNDTLIPRVFYLKSRQWDLTQAEILAGIDGAIIGKTVQHLVNILDSTRLSQIIDMYYSERGIPYQFNFRVGQRANSLQYLTENLDYTQQIYGATTLLQAIRAVYPLTLTVDYVKQLSASVGELYTNMSVSISNSYDQIEYVSNTTDHLLANLEVIVILDDTFSPYEYQRLLYTLAESIHLSYYGSSIGIINGQTGSWITNVTREYFEMFRSFEMMDQQRTWPTTLSLSRSLETVAAYYQNRTEIDCSSKVIKPIGQAVVIFSKDGRVTDNDATRSQLLVQSLKDRYPQTLMIYVSPDRNGFFKGLLVEKDDYVIRPASDVLTTVSGINKKLSVLPATLIKFYCNHEDVRFEKYLTPGVEQSFEIHREYIKRGYVTTKFLNKGYGDLSICYFTSKTSQANKLCQDVTVNGEISFKSSSLCTPESVCDVQYSLTASNSQVICAENDCRYPDQVLVIITYTYTSGSASLKPPFLISLISLSCFRSLISF